MLANPQDEKTLRRDIYALRRALREDISQVDEYINERKRLTKNIAKTEDMREVYHIVPDIAIRKFRAIEKDMKKNPVKYMDKKDLLSTYRQLKYIRGLKSSTLEGSKDIAKHFNSIATPLSKLSPEHIKKFWDTYEHLLDRAKLYRYIKYDIFTGLANVVGKINMSAKELGAAIDQLYDKSVRGELNIDENTDETTKLLFHSFESILQNY